MWRFAAVVVFSSGCYLEARTRADWMFATGSALSSGGQIDGAIVGGVELDVGDRIHKVGGAAIRERLLAQSSTTTVTDVSAPGIELAMISRAVPAALRIATAYDAALDLTGFMPPKSTNVSELRTAVAARFAEGPLVLRIGPSVSWWDAAKNGAAVGLGAEIGLRAVVDPRRW